jgi:hypothetical protein
MSSWGPSLAEYDRTLLLSATPCLRFRWPRAIGGVFFKSLCDRATQESPKLNKVWGWQEEELKKGN